MSIKAHSGLVQAVVRKLKRYPWEFAEEFKRIDSVVYLSKLCQSELGCVYRSSDVDVLLVSHMHLNWTWRNEIHRAIPVRAAPPTDPGDVEAAGIFDCIEMCPHNGGSGTYCLQSAQSSRCYVAEPLVF